MTPDELGLYAAFLRQHWTPAGIEQLIREHAVDDSGHCSSCRAGGCNSGRIVGPCSLLQMATAARGL